MKKTLVIYHRADFDGIFCYQIAKKFFDRISGYEVEYLGWDYGDPVPEVAPETIVYMLDISVEGLMDHPNLRWVDHHKSAIDKFSPTILGYRIDGVAACRLAWQYFNYSSGWDIDKTPDKEDFIERRVHEPRAVRLAGEFDIWDKRDPNAELFQHGLRSQALTDDDWERLLSPSRFPELVDKLLEAGTAVQYAKDAENASIIKGSGFTVEFEGLTFLACNAARYNSLLFTAGILPEHDALLGFNFTGRHWKVSLYHAPDKQHHDLSLIAVKYGGGGHRGACGFEVKTLPFLP
jgi:oligoribonuclease NrnB/cAMP/cGMP phosphodiesterase (DHH superfamily)